MNRSIINRYISLYKEHFTVIHDMEIYKWQAVKQFQAHWDIEAADFYSMLEKSLAKAANLLASGNYFAKAMLLEITEQFPEEMRGLFRELYSEKDLYQRVQDFREAFQKLNMAFENKKSIYQDDRAIMVYLNLRFPSDYYFYKFKMSKEFSEKVEYPNRFKQGSIENIGIYTNMCNLVRAELIKDQELIQLHNKRLQEKADCYIDESYNILTQDFIYAVAQHLTLENGSSVEEVKPFSVEEREIHIPSISGEVSFTPTQIDFEKQNRKQKYLGNRGELFVISYEQDRVSKFSKGYVERVVHAASAEGDGLGYDIRSCNDKGEEIFIEVKTTTGVASTPFYLTRTELARSKKHSKQFYLYRVFNFNEDTGVGDIHIYHGDMTALCTDPVLYKVWI